MMKRLSVVLLFLAWFAAPASGDFDAGVAAYDRGDYATALREMKPLAENGVAGAQYTLGFLHDKGLGVKQDYKEALRWYRLAADQGHAPAQLNLGSLYGNGQGVPQDYKEAFRWCRLAADQGDDYAQYNLGLMYANGQGVPRDYVQAHMWLSLAAADGYKKFLDARDYVAKKMSQAQIQEAQRLAHERKPKK
jgi:TPR repeat protein